MRLTIVFLVLAAAGCSKILGLGPPRPLNWAEWTHETKTLDEFDRDAYECRRDNPTARKQLAAEMRDRCMLFNGWRRK